jgi:hypothetical protein
MCSRLIGEARQIFGMGAFIESVLSIGTGVPPLLKQGSGLHCLEDFANVATNSEQAHFAFETYSDWLPNVGVKKYWRFNLSKKLIDPDWVVNTTKSLPWWPSDKTKYEDIMVHMDDANNMALIVSIINWFIDETLNQTLRMQQELTDKWLDEESGLIENFISRQQTQNRFHSERST